VRLTEKIRLGGIPVQKKSLVAILLAIASALVLARGQSSAQTLPTAWGFSCSGDTDNSTGHLPVALAGQFKVTSATTFSGAGDYNDAGTVFGEMFNASMTSFTDGHFTMTFSFTSGPLNGQLAHFYGAFSQQKQHMRFIQTDSTITLHCTAEGQ
jgi:hypothetical protein